MTSEKRSWYEGATYHITARGNNRNDIFRDEEDFKIYLIILEEALLYFNNYNYEIIAYCLMDNHVHLLLKTGVEPPWRFIARVHSIYARYFNKKYNYLGTLFQGRYSAEIIENDTYMLETSRYIHLNPVKARMVETPDEYKWCSYLIYVGEQEENFINSKIILNYFQYEKRFKLYREFVYTKLKELREKLLEEEIKANQEIR